MSVFADRRTFRQIGGPRAYVRQVAWSLWWRVHLRSVGKAPEALACAVPADVPPSSRRRVGAVESEPRSR